jgi:rod shape-determining protein MreC
VRRDKNIIIIFFLIIIPFFFLIFSKFSSDIKYVYLSLTSPFVSRTDSAFTSFKDFFVRVVLSNKLIDENKSLKQENKLLENKLLFYKAFEVENQRLKELLEFKKSLDIKTISAKVIGKDITSWRKSIVVDKGAIDNVKKDAVVVSSYGLVGRVVEVGKFASRILLLTDIDFKISAVFQNNRNEGIIEGTGKDFCIMKYVAQKADININSIVVSSGLGEIFPEGIIIGGVDSVGLGSDMFFKDIKIAPSINFSKIEEVLIYMSFPKSLLQLKKDELESGSSLSD